METSRPPCRRIPPRWTAKFFEVKKIAGEPAMNRDGFWKKPEFEGIAIGPAKTSGRPKDRK